jgi:hypothetical protein
MGRFVVTAIGTYIGYQVGYPQLGFVLGSALGSALFPPPGQKTEGPRLDDLRVTGLEYGQIIPFVKGHPPLPGQLWWSTDRRTIAQTTTQEGGGKGDPPENTFTTYVYEVDCFVGFTYNEMAGLAKLFIDGKLEWNVLDSASLETAAASVENPKWRRMTVYTGAIGQLPDPTMEAALGVGNTPAYWGRAGIFFEGLQLGGSGRMPFFQAHWFSKGTPAGTGYHDLFNDGATPYSGPVTPYITQVSDDDFGPAVQIDTEFGGSLPGSSATRDVPDYRAQALRVKFKIDIERSDDAPALVMTRSSDSAILLFFVPRREAAVDPTRRPEFGFLGTSLYLTNPLEINQYYQLEFEIHPGSGNSIVRILQLPNDILISEQNVPGSYTALIGDQQAFRIDQSGGGSLACAVRYSDLELIPTRAVIEEETVQDVVEALLERTGMPSDLYDVSGLASITTPVRAMAATQVVSTRQMLDQFSSCFFFDPVCGSKLELVPRGGAIAKTFDYELLAASEGAEPDAAPFDLVDGLGELEEVSDVSLAYMNMDSDGVRDVQNDDASVTPSRTQSIAETFIGFTASEAKAIVQAWRLDRVMAAKTASISLLFHDASELQPTDAIGVTDRNGRVHRVRAVKRIDQAVTLGFDCVLDDVSLLTQLGITSADYTPTEGVSLPADTVLVLLDSSIFAQDAYDDIGFWAVAAGDATPWPGARLFKSIDGIAYSPVVTFTDQGVIGTAVGALDDFDGGWVWDEVSTVTVDLFSGTLSSSTKAAMQADPTINVCAIGAHGRWEVLRFRNATLVSPGRYTLQGMLRGRRGTEWAIPLHDADDTFVMIRPAGMRRVQTETPELGVNRYWKGITLGADLDSSVAQQFANTAAGKKPYAPVQLRAQRDPATGDITLTAVRRTRLATRYGGSGGSIIPLGEDTLAFEIDIHDGSVVRRTISTSSESAVYTAAQQTTDFGGTVPVGDLDAEWFQISATVGRGYGSRRLL